MKHDCKITQPETMESARPSLFEPGHCSSGCTPSAAVGLTEDDRYPGTFFRIPGIPVPGKTTWTLSE
jgi:hypothetical protein